MSLRAVARSFFILGAMSSSFGRGGWELGED